MVEKPSDGFFCRSPGESRWPLGLESGKNKAHFEQSLNRNKNCTGRKELSGHTNSSSVPVNQGT